MNADVKRKSTQRRYSPEVKERAVRMVLALRAETGEKHGSVKRVAEQLDIGVESLRSWVKRTEIDSGERAGMTTAEAEEVKASRQENKELRRANSILRSASAFSRRSSTAHRSDRRLHRRPPRRVRS
jgi:transposase